MELSFTFNGFPSRVIIQETFPDPEEVIGKSGCLLVCDTNTEPLARIFLKGQGFPLCVLEPGEKNKNWSSAERILESAQNAGLARDGLFIGLGGGVTSDLTAFAASIYMRGLRLKLVSTTLLGMVDAAVGGKTGFDLFGKKNLAGTFYPAETIYMPLSSLNTLPEKEWKSGMAELIKIAILGTSLPRGKDFLALVKTLKSGKEYLADCITRAVEIKGRLAERDPRETKTTRMLLNLGHSFGHALESSLGLGKITHGEAVAWGMARSCDLGLALGITEPIRANEIRETLQFFEYETRAPYPKMNTETFMDALVLDKKKKSNQLTFIVPARNGAQIISADTNPALEGNMGKELILKIINGEFQK